MPELTIALAVSAFVAGVFMFLAPCTLPLVPAYLAFIGGVKPSDVNESKSARKQIIRSAIAFVIGFAFVFTLFGVMAGLFGSFTGSFRGVLTQVGGVLIILFGLVMLNVIKFAPLLTAHQIKIPAAIEPGNPVSAFLIGSIFALGWTPCVGPVLATVLLLATTSTTALSGGLLLLVFSAGLAIPFLLTAVLYTQSTKFIEKYSSISGWVNIIGGVFLVFIGILLLTDNFGLTVEYGYKVFNILGLESLFNFY